MREPHAQKDCHVSRKRFLRLGRPFFRHKNEINRLRTQYQYCFKSSDLSKRDALVFLFSVQPGYVIICCTLGFIIHPLKEHWKTWSYEPEISKNDVFCALNSA